MSLHMLDLPLCLQQCWASWLTFAELSIYARLRRDSGICVNARAHDCVHLPPDVLVQLAGEGSLLCYRLRAAAKSRELAAQATPPPDPAADELSRGEMEELAWRATRHGLPLAKWMAATPVPPHDMAQASLPLTCLARRVADAGRL